MRYDVADALVHPKTGVSLKVGAVDVEVDGEIKEGTLVEPSTNAVIPIPITHALAWNGISSGARNSTDLTGRRSPPTDSIP